MLKVDIGQRFDLDIPLIQAPMAGVSTPVLAAKVCNSGGIGSHGLGALSVFKAARAIAALREMTHRPVNNNFFVISRAL
ncbi:nitronate monooxygenase [uncultured Bartonella sp.]|uniref:nitronate monooxygenase n=1 Tax=uncultured Bartonella sp. TaxID=104108 RepID=UPI002602FC54|nr:nitronate monooxygenase [uncultured Bartonella sp.]